MEKEAWVNNTNNFWSNTLLRLIIWRVKRRGFWRHIACESNLLIFIFLIRCRIVVTLNDFNNEWDKCINEDISAVIELAPMLKQVHQFLAKTSFIVLSFEDLKKFWSDLGSHLGNCVLIKLRKCLKCLDWEVHYFFLAVFKQIEQVIQDSLELFWYLLHIVLTDLTSIPNQSTGCHKLNWNNILFL